MSIPRITNVITENNLIIKVDFSNGIRKYFDCKKILNRRYEFRKLENPEYFKNIKVDSGGHGVSWDDELDISEYEIYGEFDR